MDVEQPAVEVAAVVDGTVTAIATARIEHFLAARDLRPLAVDGLGAARAGLEVLPGIEQVEASLRRQLRRKIFRSAFGAACRQQSGAERELLREGQPELVVGD